MASALEFACACCAVACRLNQSDSALVTFYAEEAVDRALYSSIASSTIVSASASKAGPSSSVGTRPIRARVVFGHASVKAAGLLEAKEDGERCRRHTAAPKGAVDPVADLALPFRQLTPNVPGDLAVCDDRLCQQGVVRQRLLPVLIERGPIARTECDRSICRAIGQRSRAG